MPQWFGNYSLEMGHPSTSNLGTSPDYRVKEGCRTESNQHPDLVDAQGKMPLQWIDGNIAALEFQSQTNQCLALNTACIFQKWDEPKHIPLEFCNQMIAPAETDCQSLSFRMDMLTNVTASLHWDFSEGSFKTTSFTLCRSSQACILRKADRDDQQPSWRKNCEGR